MSLVEEGARAQPPLDGPPFHSWCTPGAEPWAQFYRDGPDYLVRFAGLADFHISSDGKVVHGWPVTGVPNATVQHLFLNQVLPLARSRAGQLMFHASAVVVGDGCVALMGESGRGKSTLAASFASTGSPFLTDDGLHVEITGDGRGVVRPSHPSIRLWDDSRLALIGERVQAAEPVHYTRKSRFVAGDELPYCPEPRELRHIYVLGPGQAVDIQFAPLSPATALIELVRHSFLLDIEQEQVLSSHFAQLAALVQRASFFHLDYPREYGLLEQVQAAIWAHVGARPRL